MEFWGLDFVFFLFYFVNRPQACCIQLKLVSNENSFWSFKIPLTQVLLHYEIINRLMEGGLHGYRNQRRFIMIKAPPITYYKNKLIFKRNLEVVTRT